MFTTIIILSLVFGIPFFFLTKIEKDAKRKADEAEKAYFARKHKAVAARRALKAIN